MRAEAPPAVAAPRWAAPVALTLVAVGLAASGYLTYEHFTASTTLACPDTGTINCAKVTSSPESKILGIPVAVLGLVYFAGMLPLLLPAAWRSPDRRLTWLRLAGAGLGVCFVIWFIYVELFRVDAICLWCTAVHLVTFALFAVVVSATASIPPPRPSY